MIPQEATFFDIFWSVDSAFLEKITKFACFYKYINNIGK